MCGRPSESLRSSKTSFKEGRDLGRAISFASNASSEARSTITFVPSKKTVTSRAILSLTHWTKPLGNFAFLHHLCTLIRAHLTAPIHDRSCYDLCHQSSSSLSQTHTRASRNMNQFLPSPPLERCPSVNAQNSLLQSILCCAVRSVWFERVTGLFVLANFIVMCLYLPEESNQRSTALHYTELAFAILFAVECVVRILASGMSLPTCCLKCGGWSYRKQCQLFWIWKRTQTSRLCLLDNSTDESWNFWTQKSPCTDCHDLSLHAIHVQ